MVPALIREKLAELSVSSPLKDEEVTTLAVDRLCAETKERCSGSDSLACRVTQGWDHLIVCCVTVSLTLPTLPVTPTTRSS